MQIKETALKTKDGRFVILRNPVLADAPYMIRFLKNVCEETAFLDRGKDEVVENIEIEETFIESIIESDRAFMIIAQAESADDIAGRISVKPVSDAGKSRHRCKVEIALYKKFWNIGIGKRMMTLAVNEAKTLGYTQMELEVYANNERAIALYSKLDFKEMGRIPNAAEGMDSVLMVKVL